MTERPIHLHRMLCSPPAKVYRAFLEPAAMSKWRPPLGFNYQVHQTDARVAGRFRKSFHDFSTGNGHAFGGEYPELVPHEHIRYTDRFDHPGQPGVMEVSMTLKPVLFSSSSFRGSGTRRKLQLVMQAAALQFVQPAWAEFVQRATPSGL